ncbi:hypothetical protein Q9L58_000686 [Maublancomyces gigas]|uniref:Uncharacterized protein n=1 Tax=Discina gigas TaxID=1032678 RepID=A0ABR3GW93_9PEZI
MAKHKRARETVSQTNTQSISHPPRKTAVPKKKNHKARQVTVYDAVASRASYEGFIKSTPRKNAFGEKHRRSQTAYPADEVLGRRKNAPEEPIPYGDGERQTGLPDSDLLIAIHQYASDFYAANGMGSVSYRTLDETALLAVGMLLEETARTCLGDKGDLVFVEPEEPEAESEEESEELEEEESPIEKAIDGRRRSRVKRIREEH